MPRRQRLAKPVDDPGYARALERLLADQRDTTLPSDHELGQAAVVTDADIVSASELWDQAQRAAGTGLEGLLSAKEERPGA